jgi:hypothetical protein
MTMAQDFVAHAGDEAWITTFFTNHIVAVVYSPSQNNPGVHDLGVVDGWTTGGFNIGFTGRTGSGGNMPVVSVANEPGFGDTFSSYWCPYQANAAPHAYLRNAAPYMFTAKMDGCSFGIGSPSSNGSVRVSHCNAGGRGPEQMTMLENFFSTRTRGMRTAFGRSSYRFYVGDTASTMATTFGIRVGNEWKFYSQVYLVDRTAMTLTFVSLVPVL